jgi:hypothetical protein
MTTFRGIVRPPGFSGFSGTATVPQVTRAAALSHVAYGDHLTAARQAGCARVRRHCNCMARLDDAGLRCTVCQPVTVPQGLFTTRRSACSSLAEGTDRVDFRRAAGRKVTG